MSKHDKPNRSGMSEKAQGRRVGASVLVAAASMLGTSLGVSAATRAEPQSPQDLAGQNAGETTPVDGKNLLLANEIKVNTPTPQVSVKPPVTNQFKSIGVGATTKQFKVDSSKQLKVDSSKQFKVDSSNTNQLKSIQDKTSQ